MAIYHLNARHCQRSKGQSAAAKFDYITRQGRYEKREDKCHYWSSGNMPHWASGNSRDYWEAADRYERANASLGKEVEVALPKETDLESQVHLTREFAQSLTHDRHPYTFAIHAGYGHNPHAHIFISERANDGHARPKEQHFRRANTAHPERGGAPKNREFQQRDWLKQTRALWAERTNDLLERQGQQSRVDHRSYEDQGLLRMPTRHMGPTAVSMKRRGVESERFMELAGHYREAKAFNTQAQDLRRDIERLQAQVDAERKRQRNRGLELG